jgi:hypothetical protein
VKGVGESTNGHLISQVALRHLFFPVFIRCLSIQLHSHCILRGPGYPRRGLSYNQCPPHHDQIDCHNHINNISGRSSTHPPLLALSAVQSATRTSLAAYIVLPPGAKHKPTISTTFFSPLHPRAAPLASRPHTLPPQHLQHHPTGHLTTM